MLRMMFKTSIHEHSTLSWTPNEAAIFIFTAGDAALKSCRIMPNVIVSTAIQIGKRAVAVTILVTEVRHELGLAPAVISNDVRDKL